MNSISLNKVIPSFLAERACESVDSEVWNAGLTFEKGKSYLVKADSGKGKTTLCSFIYGLRGDFSGEIRFDGSPIPPAGSDLWSSIRRESLSCVFQDMLLFEELTPLENIALKPAAGPVPSAKVKAWLAALGLEGKLGSKVGRLSFGQKQRVAFVRMLSQRADFFIMDEPVSHLDDTNCRIMSEILSGRIAELGAGVIVTSIGRDLPLDFDKVVRL